MSFWHENISVCENFLFCQWHNMLTVYWFYSVCLCVTSVNDIWSFSRFEGMRGYFKGMMVYLFHVTPNICIVFLVWEQVVSYSKDSWHWQPTPNNDSERRAEWIQESRWTLRNSVLIILKSGGEVKNTCFTGVCCRKC